MLGQFVGTKILRIVALFILRIPNSPLSGSWIFNVCPANYGKNLHLCNAKINQKDMKLFSRFNSPFKYLGQILEKDPKYTVF